MVTPQFKRDYRKAKERGLNMADLQAVLDRLCAEEPLEERHRDHALSGSHAGFRECHLRPDQLLVHATDKGRLILTTSRTGTHSDLFDE
ncbi:MAG: type II toxin-antitoxin system YafQ family toxin [Coriobacteriales bacterium]|nr:type II toxin-antitoxin system YafQ family toxin [Coriobacteriales bacterium]